jgi:hypothetical protein
VQVLKAALVFVTLTANAIVAIIAVCLAATCIQQVDLNSVSVTLLPGSVAQEFRSVLERVAPEETTGDLPHRMQFPISMTLSSGEGRAWTEHSKE